MYQAGWERGTAQHRKRAVARQSSPNPETIIFWLRCLTEAFSPASEGMPAVDGRGGVEETCMAEEMPHPSGRPDFRLFPWDDLYPRLFLGGTGLAGEAPRSPGQKILARVSDRAFPSA